MPAKILVVGPSWVGDMVMAQSLFITLRQQDPEVLIDVLAPDWSLPLLERMPEVRRAIPLPAGHGQLNLGGQWTLGRSLRGEGYDRAIVLPRKFKAALIPWFAGIPRRTGFRGEFRFGLINDTRPRDRKRRTPTVQHFVALGMDKTPEGALPVPPPKLRVDLDNRTRVVNQLALSLTAPIVGFMPGAEYGPAKQWPIGNFGELAAEIGRRGRRVWVFGSAREAELGEAIAKLAPDTVVNLCGKTALADAVDLLSLCKNVVTNDSGLMHVAAAVGVPLQAVYGSSTPDYTPPLTDRADIHYLRLSCSPCFERTCPLHHYNCLRGISVAQVLGRLYPAGN